MQIDEEVMEIVTDFMFLGSKLHRDVACNFDINRHLLLWGKACSKSQQNDEVQKCQAVRKDVQREGNGVPSHNINC